MNGGRGGRCSVSAARDRDSPHNRKTTTERGQRWMYYPTHTHKMSGRWLRQQSMEGAGEIGIVSTSRTSG
jgi:hypothetical protein